MAAASLWSSLFTRFGHSQTKFQVAETRRVNCELLTNPVTSRTEKMHLMLKHSSARTSSCSFYAPRRQYFEPILCNFDASRTWRIASKASPEKKEQKWVQEGLITESLSNGMFRVRLDNEDLILGYVSGEIRRNSIRIVPGDKVEIEVSRYDSTKGRIIYRLKIEDSTKKKTKKKKKGRKTKVAANKTVRSGGFKTTNDY